MTLLRPVSPRTPAAIVVLAAVAVAYLVVPVAALALRVPWTALGDVLAREDTREFLRITLLAAVTSSAIVVAIGVPLAVWISTLRFGGHVARLLVLLPLAMPPVVGGLALSAVLGNRGVLAPLLDAAGIQFAFAFPGVVAAHVFVSLPFVVVTVDAALRQIDREVTVSAAGVGMPPWQVLTRITLPTITPAIATGAGLAFARSLGEFGTTITFAGSMPGVTRTMSLAIYLERETDRDAAYALSAILIFLAVLALVIAFLPVLLRRDPAPSARTLAALDGPRLRELTAPDSPAAASVTTTTTTTFPAGSTTAVIGPNGSGKTTLANLIAGRLAGARTLIDGRDVTGLPIHARGAVVLTQNPGLPPVGTVSRTVSLVTRDTHRTAELLDAAGLGELADARIRALSGGQAAQVALVRALASRPRVLILDEPLAAVDAHSATRWRSLLRAAAGDRTTILITHDVVDIVGVSDRLVVLDGGEVVASGPTDDVLEVPPTDFVASLTGVNRFSGTVAEVSDGTVVLDCGGVPVVGLVGSGAPVIPGAPATATFAPEVVVLRAGDANARDSARNVWTGTVASIAAASVATTEIVLDTPAGAVTVPVTTAAFRELSLAVGDEAVCAVKAHAVSVHVHGPAGAPK